MTIDLSTLSQKAKEQLFIDLLKFFDTDTISEMLQQELTSLDFEDLLEKTEAM